MRTKIRRERERRAKHVREVEDILQRQRSQ